MYIMITRFKFIITYSNSDKHAQLFENMNIVLTGSGDPLTPPERKDSLPSLRNSPQTPRDKISVKVLTHNGSITSQSE